MDNKALKTGVYYNQNIYSDTCEQPIDVDFTLPDYCRDISKIFKCKATARITSKSINGKNITVDGWEKVKGNIYTNKEIPGHESG